MPAVSINYRGTIFYNDLGYLIMKVSFYKSTFLYEYFLYECLYMNVFI